MGRSTPNESVFIAIVLGLGLGLKLQDEAEYYTGTGKAPVESIVRQSVTGSATTIISGVGVGMMSTALPILIMAVAIVGAYSCAGLLRNRYCCGGHVVQYRDTTCGGCLRTDLDNAGGIAEMADHTRGS